MVTPGELKYRVFVDDNFAPPDRPEPKRRFFFGTFATAEEAIDTCKSLIDRSLLNLLSVHRIYSAESFFDCYLISGASPWIRAAEGTRLPEFSSRRYAAAQCESLWFEMESERV